MLVERAGTSASVRLSKKHFHEGFAELQIPPLGRDDKGESGAFSEHWLVADDEQQVPPLRFAPVGMTLLFGTQERTSGSGFHPFDGPQAHDPSGRDDTSFLVPTCQPKRDCYPDRRVSGLPSRRTELTSIWQRCQISPLFHEDGQDGQVIYLDILP
jgi:hypothetical protein